jgi:hypothetical protein
MSSCRALWISVVALGLGLSASAANAAIISVVEAENDLTTNFTLDSVPAQVGADPFGVGAWIYGDRGHVFEAPAYSATVPGTLYVNGTKTSLPSYLVGAQHVEIANDNRKLVGYSLSITTDTPSYVYLLLDNRLNGPNLKVADAQGMVRGSNKANAPDPTDAVSRAEYWTDPILGGVLQWVVDNGWQRMGTDYVAADEGNSYNTPGTTPRKTPTQDNKVGINNFYSVYRNTTVNNQIVIGQQAIDGNNMYAVVVAPIPEPASLSLLGLGALSLLARRRRA